MPSKPAKYGLKFWCLCDAATGYCLHMRPYLGSDNGAGRTSQLGMKVALELTERLDVGRTVVTGNRNAKRRQFLKMLGAELCGGEVDESGNICLTSAQESTAPPAAALSGACMRCRQCERNKTVQRCKTCTDPLCINCASYAC